MDVEIGTSRESGRGGIMVLFRIGANRPERRDAAPTGAGAARAKAGPASGAGSAWARPAPQSVGKGGLNAGGCRDWWGGP